MASTSRHGRQVAWPPPLERPERVITMLANFYSQALATCQQHGAQKVDSLRQCMLQVRSIFKPTTTNWIKKLDDACKLARHLNAGLCDQVLRYLEEQLKEASPTQHQRSTDEFAESLVKKQWVAEGGADAPTDRADVDIEAPFQPAVVVENRCDEVSFAQPTVTQDVAAVAPASPARMGMEKAIFQHSVIDNVRDSNHNAEAREYAKPELRGAVVRSPWVDMQACRRKTLSMKNHSAKFINNLAECDAASSTRLALEPSVAKTRLALETSVAKTVDALVRARVCKETRTSSLGEIFSDSIQKCGMSCGSPPVATLWGPRNPPRPLRSSAHRSLAKRLSMEANDLDPLRRMAEVVASEAVEGVS
eukprot:TRINITY_DN28756_c0_g1_i1.p1 TRINITY_DN28756_c0_g1~~TRINITY_DN28756_c0_g1_i1.p1  ORF type:complete len:381 (+),score=51.91 TRINITY_DN28756_c0_g1_i1:57-1145(+)